MRAARAALGGLALAGCVLAQAGCGDDAGGRAGGADRGAPASAPVAPAPLTADELPPSMRECHGCHRSVVETYLRHGMADSLGSLPVAPAGELVNPRSGTRYVLEPDASGGTLTAWFADGGRRRQRLVGRLGAGRLDTAFVGDELDAQP
ncbi:MAG TPA: hypothetical protein VFD43_13780 [Planctomycetota bacterium]|nr:hypothetical protein [Planctomycetota bacterium]